MDSVQFLVGLRRCRMPPLTLFATLLAAATLAQAQGSVCHYEGKSFAAGSQVPTGEKCLSCACGPLGGAPVCRLQVCPQLPVPPPKGCVLLHRRDDCCQRLVCENGHQPTAPLLESREGGTDLDLESEKGGCLVNGTLYAEGSATSSSSLCEYCYCFRGEQRCVRPQCEMPFNGCTPKYRALACCPVSYDCSGNKTAVTSTTASPPPRSGCVVEGSHHKDGSQVRSLARNCEHCYCLRGVVRCVKLECAPPLLGCEPVFAPGKCCPVQYNCSKIMTDPLYQERSTGNSSIFLQLSDGVRSLNSLSAIDLRKHREIAKNETADETTMKSEPFEILKRIENESAAILNAAQEPPLTTSAPKSTEKTTPENKSTEKTKPTSTQTTSTTPESVTEISEDDQLSAESRIDLEVTTDAVETTTSYPQEAETTTFAELPFEILRKAAPTTTTTTTTTPTPSSSTTPSTSPSTTTAATSPTSTQPPAPTSTTSAPSTSSPTPAPATPSPPAVISERVDVLLDELDETTMQLLEQMHKDAAAASTTTPRSPLPPLIEALISSKNSEHVTLENEYGEALPPSLPNITMIPFLPEDAVVEKKETGPESRIQESSTHFGGTGVPVVGAIPPKYFSPPSSFVGGFLPRQPGMEESEEVSTHLSNLVSITTSTPETVSATSEAAAPTTKDVPLASHMRVQAPKKSCVAADGRRVKHGDLMPPPGPCEICRCDHGTVLCHELIECVKLIKGAENEVQNRAEPTQAPLETKVAKEDQFSLDSVFKFLFEAPPPVPVGALQSAGVVEARRPPPRPSKEPLGPLKLAGCNIYGRMYRVGRIISELSDQCRECKCTEMGVECQPLYC